jgi:hypothetical protein
MKTLKYLISVIIFLFANTAFVFSDITASVPTNLIATIAAASSFSTINENTAESSELIQNITSEAIDTEQVLEAVQEGAEIFGQQNDDEALAAFASEDTATLTVIGGEENVFASRRDLEPNLDTIVYDTGVMILTNEAESGSDIATNYNDDSSNRIFDDTLGAQTARIIIYVDFKRNVLFGEIESTVTLQGESGMTTLAKGGAADISNLDFGEPIDKELTKTLDTTTGGLMPDADAPYAYYDTGGEGDATGEGGKHSITSIVREDGTPASFDFGFDDEGERKAFQKEYSHDSATGGKGNVLIGARFKTPGGGTFGTSTASFEASHGSGAAGTSAADYIGTTEGNDRKVVRYSATATTTATNIKD